MSSPGKVYILPCPIRFEPLTNYAGGCMWPTHLKRGDGSTGHCLADCSWRAIFSTDSVRPLCDSHKAILEGSIEDVPRPSLPGQAAEEEPDERAAWLSFLKASRKFNREEKALILTGWVERGKVEASRRAQAEGEYFILSLKHSKRRDGVLTWWAPDNKGYQFVLTRAGKYPRSLVEKEPEYYNNGQDTLAIPVNTAGSMAKPNATWQGPCVPYARLKELREALSQPQPSQGAGA